MMSIRTYEEYVNWVAANGLTSAQQFHLDALVENMHALGADLSECYKAAVELYRSIVAECC